MQKISCESRRDAQKRCPSPQQLWRNICCGRRRRKMQPLGWSELLAYSMSSSNHQHTASPHTARRSSCCLCRWGPRVCDRVKECVTEILLSVTSSVTTRSITLTKSQSSTALYPSSGHPLIVSNLFRRNFTSCCRLCDPQKAHRTSQHFFGYYFLHPAL